MKIEITEEMREAVRMRAEARREAVTAPAAEMAQIKWEFARTCESHLARLVAEAVEKADPTHETKLDCCNAHIWTCRCGRTVCTDCEGTTDQPDLCDECWVEREEEAGDA